MRLPPPSKNLTPGIQVVDDDTILAITNHVYGEYSLAALISNSYLKEQVHDTFRSTYLLCLLLAGVGFLLIFLSLRSTYPVSYTHLTLPTNSLV